MSGKASNSSITSSKLKLSGSGHDRKSSGSKSLRQDIPKPKEPPPAPPPVKIAVNIGKRDGRQQPKPNLHPCTKALHSFTTPVEKSSATVKHTYSRMENQTTKKVTKKVSFSEDSAEDVQAIGGKETSLGNTCRKDDSVFHKREDKFLPSEKPLFKSGKSYPAPDPPKSFDTNLISNHKPPGDVGSSTGANKPTRIDTTTASSNSDTRHKPVQESGLVPTVNISLKDVDSSPKLCQVASDGRIPVTDSGNVITNCDNNAQTQGKLDTKQLKHTPVSPQVKRLKSRDLVRPKTPPPLPPQGHPLATADSDDDLAIRKKDRKEELRDNAKIIKLAESEPANIHEPLSINVETPTGGNGPNTSMTRKNEKLSSHRRSAKKTKTFALGWCCGLGRSRTPPLELPMRSAGPLYGSRDVLQILENEKQCNSCITLEQGQLSPPLPDNVMDHITLTSDPGTVLVQSCDTKSGANLSKDTIVPVSEVESPKKLPEEKPVVHDVKLLKHERPVSSPMANKRSFSLLPKTKPPSSMCDSEPIESEVNDSDKIVLREPTLHHKQLARVRSLSVEDMTDIVVNLDLDLANQFERNKSYRSSFLSEDGAITKPAVCHVPGEFQTVLKHSNGDKVYALPQPQCYSEDTLKAVKSITEKYDTVQRWKQRAQSFRESTLRNGKFSRQNSKEEAETLCAEETDQSYTSTLTRSGHNIKPQQLSEKECSRVEFFYRSNSTHVFVCPCEADLFFAAEKSSLKELKSKDKSGENAGADCDLYTSEGFCGSPVSASEWEYKFTGVPVWIFNSGEAHRPRELILVLAERHSSFPLWQDKLNYLSQYSQMSSSWHTMHLSTSLLKVVALRFSCAQTASEFFNKFKEVTADPNDDLWKVASSQNRRKVRKKNKAKRLVKGDISNPCHFSHITTIGLEDMQLLRGLDIMCPSSPEIFEQTSRPRAYSG